MPEKIQQEKYVVTARKWRPLRFDDVVGQKHITQTLKNAIKSNRIHHAYLFSGPRGVGKTTTARILGRALNCHDPKDNEPCNKCESCLSVIEGRSIDIIEIDGASNNSVDDVRKLRENAKYPPSYGKYKMYIIDEVHMLSNSAFNALLKTLEEPPPHLIFVFATTEAHKVPPTILSRCQRFEFRRMNIEDIVKQLSLIAEKENIKIDDESLITIAQKADGSMRDGQSIFDQVIAFCGKDISYSEMADALRLIDQEFYFRISKAIHDSNVHEAFLIARDVVERGYDIGECLSGMLEHFRNMMAIKASGNTDLIDASPTFLEKYAEESENFSQGDILRCMNIIAATEQNIRFSAQPRVRFELALVKMATMESTVSMEELINDIKNISAGSPLPAQKNNDLTGDENKTDNKTGKPKINDNSQTTLKNHWDNFIDHYIDSHKYLNTLQSKNSVEPEFFNGEIILNATNKFHEESIERKKDNIEALMNEYFGKKVTILVQVKENKESKNNASEPKQKYPSSEKNDVSKSDAENKDFKSQTSNKEQKESEEQKRHPVDQKVIELFDARESL